VKAKQAGREIQPVTAPQPTNVINLMDALRRTVAAEKAQTSVQWLRRDAAEKACRSGG
jgi:non-homologous end joining protein Ku